MNAQRNEVKAALKALADPYALRANALLDGFADASHDERCAAVLRAVEQLHPGAAAGPDSARRRRKHAMIERCDILGEAHEAVASDLGVSIRQFYRERNEALEDIVRALTSATTQAVPAVRVETDAFAMRERLLQKLRGCGEHGRVFTEACTFATQIGETEKAIEFWTVAAEAGRYMNDLAKSRQAIHAAKRVCEAAQLQRSVSASILIAISEIALDWTRARYIEASERVERVMRESSYGRALAGLDATLFGIMLTYGISVEIERGRWSHAQTLLRHLEEMNARIDPSHISPSLRRHAGRVALRAHHDGRRAVVELRESLAVAQRFDNLAAEAYAATELGVALADSAPDETQRYVQYGLQVGRHVLGRNEFAMLALGAMPTMLATGAEEESAALVDELRTLRLADRAKLALDLAEVRLLLYRRAYKKVAERAEQLAGVFDSRGMIASAAEARTAAAGAYTALGRHPRARRLQRELQALTNP